MASTGTSTDKEHVVAAVTHFFSGSDYGISVCTDDCIGIRPSGNPINMPDMVSMMGSDIEWKVNELWSIDNVRFLGNGSACVVTAKCHQEFSYKGNPNDDVSNNTLVLEKQGDAWKVAQWHRAPGVLPTNATPKSV